MTERLARLRALLAEIDDLRRSSWVLAWDQEVMMPPKGAAARAEQRATLERLAHERVSSAELGRLVEELRAEEESLPYESADAALIRVARRDHEKATRVPPELRAELTRAGSLAVAAWLAARDQSDWAVLLPHLEHQLELKWRYIECFAPYDDPYDVLLDEYEDGTKTSEVEAIFGELRRELTPLVATVRDAEPVDDSCLQGPFDLDAQRAFVLEVLERLGYDAGSWRLDSTQHPFATAFANDDVRLTTHLYEEHLGGVFATIHEFGHGLYEHQIDRALARTPVATGSSGMLHESQSRMWENVVGRRRAFWTVFYPRLQSALPQFERVPVEVFVRAVNKVEPSLIRVDADEVTYNLHIILRFELERDVLAGRLALRDLPAAFAEKMHESLGIDVPDVVRGALQDVHWAGLGFGSFSSYALGNVASVQIWERALRDHPDLTDQIERGEFATLREWLGEHLHRHGRSYLPKETLERAAGGPIDVQPYLRYLREKVDDLIGTPA